MPWAPSRGLTGEQGHFILGLTCFASPPDRCRSGASTSGPWGGSVTNTEAGAVSCRFHGQ